MSRDIASDFVVECMIFGCIYKKVRNVEIKEKRNQWAGRIKSTIDRGSTYPVALRHFLFLFIGTGQRSSTEPTTASVPMNAKAQHPRYQYQAGWVDLV